MQILITGVTGVLGSCLAKALVNKQYNVIGLKRVSSDIKRIQTIMDKQNFEVFDLDYKFNNAFKSLCFDIVIHTAANYGKHESSLSNIIEANELFPLQLLEYVLDKKVSFINTHSSLPMLTNPYTVSKNSFLNWGQYFASLNRVQFVNVRLEHFYGERDNHFIEYLIHSMLEPVSQLDLTKGEQKRDFIHINDVVAAYLKIVENLHNIPTNFMNIDVGSGSVISIKELVLLVQKLTQNSVTKLNFGVLPYRKNELMESSVDLSFLKSIGWAPKYDLTYGLNSCIKGYLK